MNKPQYIYERKYHYEVRFNGEYKYYNFSDYGTKAKALRAAKLYLRDYAQQNGLAHILRSRKRRNIKENNRNQLGVFGIYAVPFTGKEPEDRKYQSFVCAKYVAKKGQKGRQIRKYFNVEDYGELHAFLKACKTRLQLSGELRVTDVNKLPVPLKTLKDYFPELIINKR